MSGQTVFITGSNSGLGLAAVRLFAARGWNVAATMRRMDQAGVLAGLPNVQVFPLDVTDESSIFDAVQAAVAAFDRIDVLINNAGYCLFGPLETTSLQQIRDQYETNLFGLLAVTKAVLPQIRTGGGGRIINISSISADAGYPFVSAYGSSKAAIASLSETLNIELHDASILVKAVHPGLFATEIFSKLRTAESIPGTYQPLLNRFLSLQRSSRASSPDECARVIYRAATDRRPDRVHYYAGRDATMLRRLKRLVGPEAAFRIIKRQFTNGISSWMRWFLPKGDSEISVALSDLNEHPR